MLSELGWDPSLCLLAFLEGWSHLRLTLASQSVGEDAWLCQFALSQRSGLEEEKRREGWQLTLGMLRDSMLPRWAFC